MRRVYILLLSALLLVPVFAGTAWGQNRGRPETDRRPPTSEERGKAEQRRREVFIMRLLEYLDLSQEQSTEFLPILNHYMQERENLFRDRMGKTTDLVKLLENESSPVGDLRKKLAEVETLSERIEQQRKEFLKLAKPILSDRQYIKLAIFDERLKLRFMEHMDDRSGNPE